MKSSEEFRYAVDELSFESSSEEINKVCMLSKGLGIPDKKHLNAKLDKLIEEKDVIIKYLRRENECASS